MQHLAFILQNFSSNSIVIQQLLSDVTSEMAHWRPAPEKWNLLEIICHLRDEENEDFRRRVAQTLDNPNIAPPPIDPEAWVTTRNYDGEDFAAMLRSFSEARQASIAWLETLEQPNWENAWLHPRGGPLSAGLFLNNWLAHDYLHIRQIVALKFAYLQHISGEDLGYAGNW